MKLVVWDGQDFIIFKKEYTMVTWTQCDEIYARNRAQYLKNLEEKLAKRANMPLPLLTRAVRLGCTQLEKEAIARILYNLGEES